MGSTRTKVKTPAEIIAIMGEIGRAVMVNDQLAGWTHESDAYVFGYFADGSSVPFCMLASASNIENMREHVAHGTAGVGECVNCRTSRSIADRN